MRIHFGEVLFSGKFALFQSKVFVIINVNYNTVYYTEAFNKDFKRVNWLRKTVSVITSYPVYSGISSLYSWYAICIYIYIYIIYIYIYICTVIITKYILSKNVSTTVFFNSFSLPQCPSYSNKIKYFLCYNIKLQNLLNKVKWLAVAKADLGLLK